MEPHFEIAYGKNQDAGNYADINGIKLYYEVYGKGSPLFIIHGNGSSIAGMSYQIDYFKSQFMVVAADSRGHGKSGTTANGLSYQQMAEDYLGLSNHLGLKSLDVLGWSDGGILGIYMAMLEPEKIAHLVTMGANVKPQDQSMIKLEGSLVSMAIQEAKAKIQTGINQVYWQRKLEQLLLLKDQPNIDWDDLKKINCPTLIMAGEKDSVLESHTSQIAAAIPNSSCMIFEKETHFMPVSNPEKFNRVVHEFMVRV